MLCCPAGEKAVAEGGSGGLKFLLVAGRPIGEPIVQYGPFVMNSVSVFQSTQRHMWLPI